MPKSPIPIPLDNLQDLRRVLWEVRIAVGSHARIILWKSDVKSAYRLMPMSPFWQIKQVVKIDGRFNVDRCNNFGGRTSGNVWGVFFSLVLWIATFVKLITDVHGFVDDVFSWDVEGNMVLYGPYDTYYPSKQAHFLLLLDELGIPHDKAKQLCGSKFTIIGFEVDANAMTITMPDDGRRDLIAAIRFFAIMGRRPTLNDYQRLAGWINWSLNVYPLLHPGLSTLYAKTAGKSLSHWEIYVNKQLCRELLWIANYLETAPPIFMMDSVDWPLHFAEYTLYTDACLFGMGFWSPSHSLGFQSPVDTNARTIFYWEAYAVLSAFYWLAHHRHPPPHRVAIFTDNMNTVHMFHSLRATPEYNPILMTTVEIMMTFNIQLQVVHIPGEQNVVADALSRFNNHYLSSSYPALHIRNFQPPHLSMGAEFL